MASSGLFFLGNLGLMIVSLRPWGLRLLWLAMPVRKEPSLKGLTTQG